MTGSGQPELVNAECEADPPAHARARAPAREHGSRRATVAIGPGGEETTRAFRRQPRPPLHERAGDPGNVLARRPTTLFGQQGRLAHEGIGRSTLTCMAGRLKVTLTGGSERYLEVSGNARELLLLIAAGNVGRRWLPLEGKGGVVRVDAIVCMTIEGTPDDVEHERDRLDAQLMELAGIPKMDDADVYGFERRGR
jgi:hypothetical protein